MGVLYKLDSAPAVHRYIDNEPVTSQEQFRNVIAVICGQYCEKIIGRWPVVRKADTICVLVETVNTVSVNVLERVEMKQADAFFLDVKPHLWSELKARK